MYILSREQQLLFDCLNAIMPDHEVKQSVATILKTFCDYFAGDRCYLLEFNREESCLEIIGEYCSRPAAPIMQRFAKVPISTGDQWFTDLLTRHKPICYDVENDGDLESSTGIWAEVMRRHGVKKLYSMPIFFQGKLWGCWCLYYKREAQTPHVSLMRLIPRISNMIELVLSRQIYLSELENSREQAQAATRAKSAFLATMSHELRTPLNAIIGLSELMADGGFSEKEQQEYLSGIHHAGKALLSLINDILDFSKIETEQIKIVPAPVSLNALFDELNAVLRQMAEAKEIALSFILPPDLPPLQLDELRTRQILLNLIGNAIKYTEKGEVTVTARYLSPHLSIQVADTGIGIEPEAQKAIFEPFVQQDAIRDTKVYQGTGLGLAIAGKLAKRMNGEITLASEPGKGSVFTLILNDILPAQSNPREISRENSEHKITGNRQILLVDDIPMNLKVLAAMFRETGFSVQQATSAKEALALLRRHPVDYVFTDLWMPEMSGKDLTAQIHAAPELSQVKVVAVTADVTILDAQDSGFDAILLKPVTREKLKSVLHQLASRSN